MSGGYGAYSFYDFILRLLGMVSDVWEAAFVCLLLSIGVTQWTKPLLSKRMKGHALRSALQLVAFCSGALPLLALHPSARGAVMGALVGVASPLIYTFATFLIWRKWPALGRALSADSPTYSFSDFLREQSRSPQDCGGESPPRESNSHDSCSPPPRRPRRGRRNR
jgi:hypothetical protein